MTRDERWLLEEKYAGNATAAYEADRARLATGEPLGYVIGWQPFLGLRIYLDSKPLIPPYSAPPSPKATDGHSKATQGTRPLIPRPETEWWTEQLLQNAQAHRLKDVSERDGARDSKFLAKNYACPEGGAPVRFLDLCAGSGAIGCAALARLPNAQVSFGEIDPAHEATILKNIRENGLDGSRARVRIGDLFEPFHNLKFDIIAANPPYVPAGRALPASVAEHEPALALSAGEDGLAVIRRIAEELPKRLAEGGEAWIECDSAHAAAACALFTAQGFSAKIRTDQYGKLRLLVVSFP